MREINLKKYKNMVCDIIKYGKFDSLDTVLPDSIDFSNPEYFKIGKIFYSGIIVVNYSRVQEASWISPLFNLDFNANICFFYEKQNSGKVINELTYYIGNLSGAVNMVSSNQQDIDVLETSCEDAKYIRKQMQIDKEDLYYLCMYIIIFDENLENMKLNLERFKGICASMGLQTRKALFRQEFIFKSMLPICNNERELRESAARNVLTDGLVSTFPFISAEIYDPEGVLIGHNSQNKSLVVVDRFDSKTYKNANMCVLGTSGAGKSFFVKLMILRNRYLGIRQFVIDPDGEYSRVCKSLDGVYLELGGASEKYINIMDIRETSFFEDEKKGYLLEKVSKLKSFIKLIYKKMAVEEENLLVECIIKCYEDKGITFDDSTLFEECESKIKIRPQFISSDRMPILGDLYNLLAEKKECAGILEHIKPYVSGNYSFFNKHTNVDFNNSLIVADIHKLDEGAMSAGMYLVIDTFWDKIKSKKGEKKVIYIDEVWKLLSEDEDTAKFVYKMFKTIRKYGGGATAITQDVSDFFAYNEGKYGKVLINNSALKFVLQLEKEDIKLLEDVLNLSDEEKIRIKAFERGTGLFFADKNHAVVNVEANEEEYKLITTDRADIERMTSEIFTPSVTS